MLSTTLRVALGALAIYRLAFLFSQEAGPLDLFTAARAFLGRKASGGGIVWRTIAELVNCVFCLGVWLALFVGVLVLAQNIYGDFILIVFGMAGAQFFLLMIAGASLEGGDNADYISG